MACMPILIDMSIPGDTAAMAAAGIATAVVVCAATNCGATALVLPPANGGAAGGGNGASDATSAGTNPGGTSGPYWAASSVPGELSGTACGSAPFLFSILGGGGLLSSKISRHNWLRSEGGSSTDGGGAGTEVFSPLSKARQRSNLSCVAAHTKFAALKALPVPSSILTFQNFPFSSHSMILPTCPFSSALACKPVTRTTTPGPSLSFRTFLDFAFAEVLSSCCSNRLTASLLAPSSMIGAVSGSKLSTLSLPVGECDALRDRFAAEGDRDRERLRERLAVERIESPAGCSMSTKASSFSFRRGLWLRLRLRERLLKESTSTSPSA
mmetsp:Transcript_92291/g.143978  ORF Transcript_92291/g.143978 Transcript_92291/m.143978 type:complete len:326 (-) Transcript_92291:354-1331(-)